MFQNFNINSWKACAFCIHWYDPSNKYIKPTVYDYLWQYDNTARSKCMKRNIQTGASENCPNYQRKV